METMFAFWRGLSKRGATPCYPIGASWEHAEWAVESHFPTPEFEMMKRGIVVSNFHKSIPYDDCRGFFRPQER